MKTRYRIAKRVPGNRCGTRIHTLGPREDALHLKPVAQALGQLRFQRVVVRMTFVDSARIEP